MMDGEEEDWPKNFRLKGMILCEIMARMFRQVVDLYGRDTEHTIVYLVVIAASGSHIRRDPDLRARFAHDEPISQDVFHGVSRRAIADSTGLPRERVRRMINRLVKEGYLLEEDGMVLPRAPVLGLPENAGFVRAMLKEFERAHMELERADEV
jgi:hypothetical protein